MRFLKIIGRMTVGLLQYAWRFPRRLSGRFKQRRPESALYLQELERLDRIRHPSKYLGKS